MLGLNSAGSDHRGTKPSFWGEDFQLMVRSRFYCCYSISRLYSVKADNPVLLSRGDSKVTHDNHRAVTKLFLQLLCHAQATILPKFLAFPPR